MEEITSRHNPLAVQIGKLNSSRSFRREERLFTGEGPKLLNEAIKSGVPLAAVVTPKGGDIFCSDGVRRVEMPKELFRSLCDTRSPQGVLFLCRMWDTTPPAQLSGSRYLVLDGLQDPGNVGTIWRTADAMGADGVLLVNSCADPFSPKTVRATMGACFRLPVYELEAKELPGLMERSGLPLYATALGENNADLREADLSRCAVVIGSEGSGVSHEVLDICQKTLKIPMRERCESLNASAAAAVALWEMCGRYL